MRKLTMQELGRPDIERFKQAKKLPVVIVLDNVRSLHNVGSAFRTADAFGVEKIVLCGITGKPPHREIEKTALGATHSVDWEYMMQTADAIQLLRSQGYKIASVEQTDQSTSLADIQETYPLAVIFGNEVHGVSEEVLHLSDFAIEVPQMGTKHSLNISVCVGVVVWELFKKKLAG